MIYIQASQNTTQYQVILWTTRFNIDISALKNHRLAPPDHNS